MMLKVSPWEGLIRYGGTSLAEINYTESKLEKSSRFISDGLNFWNDVIFEMND